jgi:predicted ATP-dependent serine protease
MIDELEKDDTLSALSHAVDLSMQNEQSNHEKNRIKYRIDVKEIIPAPQIAWSFNGAIIGTLGNFSLIIGKAKAKKTFLIGIAVSTAVSKDLIFDGFISNLPSNQNRVLYFDTEQGKYHVQKVIRRICILSKCDEPKNLDAYYLRSLNPRERLEFIETEIYSNDDIGFVVIDGIKDLVTSINDEEQATNIACKLLKWTEDRNIHIVTVLHQNKGDNNARGHIGTELINKAETVLSVAVVENDKEVSIVEPQQCRNREPESFVFKIDENGLPFIVIDYEATTKKTSITSVINLEDFKKYQLLTEVFSHGKEFKYGELVSQLKLAYKNQIKKDLGDNKIKDLVTDCKNNGWILQVEKGQPYSLGDFTSI